jgi:hypothetical protein
MLATLTPVSVITHQGFTGPVINFISSPVSILDNSSKIPITPNILAVGVHIRITLLLDIWCIATPPAFFTFTVMLGTVPVFSTAPVACLPFQFVNYPARVTFDLRVDTEGSPNKGMLVGYFTTSGPMWAPIPLPTPTPYSWTFPVGSSQVVSGVSGAMPKMQGLSGWTMGNRLQPSFPFPPGSLARSPSGPRSPIPAFPTPPQFAAFDTGASAILDIFCGCTLSDFGNAVQVNDYLVESLSPMPSVTLPDNATGFNKP